MSSVIILKNIENYSPEQAVEASKQAARRAGMFCFLLKFKYSNGNFLSAEETLSEVDEVTFQNTENKDSLKYFTFNANNIEEDSYDSFTWLTQNKYYFWAIDIENINHEYEFIYSFVIEYFKENSEDYLWFDDDDWYYTADDILKLSHMPYNHEWCSKKIV
ncbi:hypothetical protein NYE69_30100 [Paenibacillus sp. FSL R5-0527]|uniref:hypothetical protein n=1 Tax=Paenibacillus sp. FSL R5-0527 TaxID=2975321 RepID=UPI00097B0AED|nr:hypothetical protein BK140_33240 [Paenibacillus macerans]